MLPANQKKYLSSKLVRFFLLIFFLFAAAMVFRLVQVSAFVSNEINYQGKLTDSNGINVANGYYDFRVRVYDAAGTGSPPTGGNLLYSEDKLDIQVSNGIFNLKFTPSNAALSTADTYVQVCFNASMSATADGATGSNDGLAACGSVSSDSIYDKAFSPRKKITSNPYSLMSKFLGSTTISADSTGVLTIGVDQTTGTTNTTGQIKLISAGDNAFSTIFQPGTQTQNVTYTLPTAQASGSGYVLSNNGSGVLSWNDPTSFGAWTTSGSNVYLADGTKNVGIGGVTSPAAKLEISTNASSNIGLLIKGVASQSSALQEWRDSNNSLIASINANGTSTFGGAISVLNPSNQTGALIDVNGSNGTILAGRFTARTSVTTPSLSVSGQATFGGGGYTYINSDGAGLLEVFASNLLLSGGSNLKYKNGAIVGTLTWNPTTTDKTITLPNETGTVCTTGNVCSGYQASGSYLTSEADTLASVTGRGATTSTAVTLSGGASFPGSGIWNASGNVGIGNASPTYDLDITAATHRGINIINTKVVNSGDIYGVYSNVSANDNANYATNVYGGYFKSSNIASGTVGLSYGIYAESTADDADTTYGVYGKATYAGVWGEGYVGVNGYSNVNGGIGGSFSGTDYGITANASSDSGYGVFSQIGKSYFGDKVGIGQTSPTHQLHFKGETNVPLTGVVTITSGSSTVTGSGTLFLTELKVGDAIRIGSGTLNVIAIASNTSLTVGGTFGQSMSTTGFKNSPYLKVENTMALGNTIFEIGSHGGVGISIPVASSITRTFQVGNMFGVNDAGQVELALAVGNNNSALCQNSSGYIASCSSTFLSNEVDGEIGNEVTGASGNNTLLRSGSGTAASPYLLGLNLGNANTWTATHTFPSINIGIGSATTNIVLDVTKNQTSGVITQVKNTNTGSAYAQSIVAADTSSLNITSLGTGFATNDINFAAGHTLEGGGAGGLSIGATNASGIIRFYSGGGLTANERMRIASDGNVAIGTTTTTAAKLTVNGLIKSENPSSAGIQFVDRATNDLWQWYGYGSSGTGVGVAHLYMGSANTMSVSDNGNIAFGVNSTSGTTTLDIGGTANTVGVCHTGGNSATDNVTLVDCSGTAGADYMEMYPVSSDATLGDIVSVGTNNVTTTQGDTIKQLVKSNSQYQMNVIGIVSDKSQAGDFNSIGYNINESDNPQPIALNGRVPVKVSTENGAVNPGDLLTTSSKPGVAMKATSAGFIVGKALASYTNADPNAVGMVMVYVNNTYYNPNTTTSAPAPTPTAPTGSTPSYWTLTGSNLSTAYNVLIDGDTTAKKATFNSVYTQLVNVGSGKLTVDSTGNLSTVGSVTAAIVDAATATISNLTVDKLNVSSTAANPTVGTGTITAGQQTVVINNTNVTANSKIFVTITSAEGDSLRVVQKVNATSFTVKLNTITTSNVTFDYWIIGE